MLDVLYVLQAAWLLKAVTCIDLTTLSGDDTPSNVHRLCLKAIQPVRHDLLSKMDMHNKGLLLLMFMKLKEKTSFCLFVKHTNIGFECG